MSATVSWPDTGGDAPPTGRPYLAAIWLLGQHPQVARAAERAGVVAVEDGERRAVTVNASRYMAIAVNTGHGQ